MKNTITFALSSVMGSTSAFDVSTQLPFSHSDWLIVQAHDTDLEHKWRPLRLGEIGQTIMNAAVEAGKAMSDVIRNMPVLSIGDLSSINTPYKWSGRYANISSFNPHAKSDQDSL